MANFNLDVTLKIAIEEFAKKDPVEVSKLSGCVYSEEKKEIVVSYLGESYIVIHPEGYVYRTDETDVNMHLKILLLHYLIHANGQAFKNQWISFKELPDGFIYIDPFRRRVIEPMLKLFSNELEKFYNLAQSFGGRKENLGDMAVTIDVLPRVPITYVIYQADEEFAASGNVLFDASAPGYLPTEDYAFLAQFVILKMKELTSR